MLNDEQVKVVFNKVGMEVQKKIEILGEMEWHVKKIDYGNIEGKKIEIDNLTVEPVIEKDVLKCITINCKDVSFDEPKRGRYTPGSSKFKGGIIINGEDHKCRFGYDLLVNSINWLIERGLITEDDIPYGLEGSVRWFINR